MKVLYELDLNDIIRIVAEKYGVPQEKVKKTNKDGLNYLMIDMSTTETPGQLELFRSGRLPKDKMKQMHDLSMEMFHPKKEEPAPETLTVNVTAPAEDIKRFIDKEAEEVKPVRYEDPDEAAEARYKKITDELLQEYIAAERTIPQICKAYELTDSKYSARLYKRAEQFRKEGARLGRRRNQEKTEETEQSAG